MKRASAPTPSRVIAWLPGIVVALVVSGCAGQRDRVRDPLVERVVSEVHAQIPAAATVPSAADLPRGPAPAPGSTRPNAEVQFVGHDELPQPAKPDEVVPPFSEAASPEPADADIEADVAGRPLTLEDAVALSFRRQPRLRGYLEGIRQAGGLSNIAFAPFLPTLGTGYSVGGFDLNVGGTPLRIGQQPGFTVLPPGFALPVGLNIQTGYELAEMKLQWLICDFGQRMGRYNASRLAVEIHKLQTDRAYQTVGNEVTLAYYNVLRNQALRRVAKEAVHRAEDELDVARKLEKGGVIEREKVLRAEVQLAESLQFADASEEAVSVALAALNLAIGLRSNEAIQVVEPLEVPTFAPTLSDCLQTAINQRREFRVVRRSIQIAQEGTRVARAEFAPRIVAEGALFDLQQSSPRGNADVALGFIKMEWIPFQGGKKIAERDIADSKVREAMAQAESIADTIAFQVNEAYRRLATARLGIERSRPAVDQAQENYRLVRARAADATPSEVTDAETALTRAQQNRLNSVYDYLMAVAKIEYAMGTAPLSARASRNL